MPKTTKLILQLTVSLLLLLLLTSKVDWRVVGDAVYAIRLSHFVFSLLVWIACLLLVAGKYYLLVKGTPISLSMLAMVKITWVTNFYGLFLPSAIGPEAVRWYKVTRNEKNRLFFLASTIFERLVTILVILSFGIVALYGFSDVERVGFLKRHIAPVLFPCGGLVVLGVSFFIVPNLQPYFLSMLKKIRLDFLQRVSDSHLWEHLTLNSAVAHLPAKIVLLSVLWQLIFILRLYFLFTAADMTVTLVDVTWIGSITLLLQIIPISFAGIGIREGAYAYFITFMGYPSEAGVLIGVLLFSQLLIIAFIGGILELINLS
jgi:uncharacterized membrane protein YbhN (UPF0104 family)